MSYITMLITDTGHFIFCIVKTEVVHVAIVLHLVAMAERGRPLITIWSESGQVLIWRGLYLYIQRHALPSFTLQK
jgi:protein-S-isoprenylcysteine O-methyltransferase Ste14